MVLRSGNTPPRAGGLNLRLVTFDPFRSLGIPGAHYVRPESYLAEKSRLLDADWLLFPEYWQVNSLYYALGCPLFPSLASYHLGHDKIEMTRALQALCPQHVPETLILPSTAASVDQVLDVLGANCIAKVPRSSMGQGVELIRSENALRAWAAGHDILYIQEVLPIRRDIRVVWVGDAVLTAYWREAADGQFHNNIARGARVGRDAVPRSALDLVSVVARSLGIDHAGFDVAMVEGHPYLLEFNTLFGTAGLAERGLRLSEAILRWLVDQRRPPRSPCPPLAA